MPSTANGCKDETSRTFERNIKRNGRKKGEMDGKVGTKRFRQHERGMRWLAAKSLARLR